MGRGGWFGFWTRNQALFVAFPLQTGSCVTHELRARQKPLSLVHGNSACLFVCVCVYFLLSFSNFSSSAGDLPKENPYEDVDLKSRRAGRKPQQLSENSLDSLHRMWSPQDRKYNNPPTQVTAALMRTYKVSSRPGPASAQAFSLTSAWQR